MRGLIIGALFAGSAAVGIGLANGATPALSVPLPQPPAELTVPKGQQVAVLAGGCFWGMEGLFEHVKGVSQVTAGYAGGTAQSADYETVSSETTNHAEAVRIVFDPAQVSYGQLLQIYFSVAHDPTEVEGQYPDQGHSYRSAVFPQNPDQRKAAAAYIASVDRAHTFARPVATKLETGAFYPAEGYHQGFMRAHPDHPYIQRWDVPKLAKLQKAYPALYRS